MRPRFLAIIPLVLAGTVSAQGVPDLQGVWFSNAATPLERPAQLADRATLTDAEVAELKARATRLFKDGHSDFAAGDAAFMAALNNETAFASTTATDRADFMIEREFDNRTSLITDPPDGKIPPLTSAAQRRRRERADEISPINRCISYGVPRLGGNFGAGPNSYYEIFQSPGFVVFFMEGIHEARIIPLDGSPHAPKYVQLWNGDSRGRWAGNALVIDTTNFSARNNFMGAAENLHLTERLTRTGPDEIRYEITVEDPTTWIRPWSAMIRLRHSPDRLFEFACHEGNYLTMQGILGARQVDALNPAR